MKGHGSLFARLQRPAAFILCLLIQHGKDPLRAGNRSLELPVNLGDFIDGPAKLLRIYDERGDHAHRNQPFHRKISPENGNDDKTDIPDTVHHRPHNAAEDIRFDPCFCEGISRGAKIRHCDILMVVCYHRAVPGNHFLHSPVQPAQKLLAFP